MSALRTPRSTLRTRVALGLVIGVGAVEGMPSVLFAQSAPTDARPTGPRLTRPPRLTHFVDAPYPEVERAAGRSAAVVLQLTVSATGTVEEATVTQSAGVAFDDAAVAAARQFVFEPAEVDGHPSRIRLAYRYQFVLRVEVPTTAVFDGVVRNRSSRAPLAGVSVDVDGGEHTVTDAQGRFHLDGISPGHRAVSLAGPRLTPQRVEEAFEAGQHLEAAYDVTLAPPAAPPGDDDMEIVVIAPRLHRQVVTTTVSADQASRVPGTQGDVLRVVENLPGVARSAVGAGQLIVWGASPQDTRVYLDGVPIPQLYHGGGLRSVVPTDFVDSVDLAPGGYGAAYGGGLGGIVSATTRTTTPPGFHGSASADLMDAGASARAATGPWQFAVGGRRSYLDSVLDAVGSSQVGQYFPIPRYDDAQARVAYALSPHESVEVTGLLSNDQFSQGVPNADPSLATRQDQTTSFQRVYLRYRHQLADGSSVSVVPYFGADYSNVTIAYGQSTTALTRNATVGGMRASWRTRSTRWLSLEAGLDAQVTASSLQQNGSVGDPPREGDIRVFGQPSPNHVSADTWNVLQVNFAPYAEGDLTLLNGTLHVIPGLRADPSVRSVSRRTPEAGDTPQVGLYDENFVVEPRLAVRWSPWTRWTFRGAVGMYHEAPQPTDLSAVFGNPLLRDAEAVHTLVGVATRITETLSLEVTGFYESLSGLAVRNPAPNPLATEALVGIGVGRSYGVQMLLRQELAHHFFGWLSYTLSRSERRDAPDAAWRLSDYDQTHVLTVLFTYDFGRGWEAGLRARYATGYPRTEVVGSYYDALLDRYQPLFGAQNGVRIPAFFQLDARVAKRFRLGATTLDVYVEVQNLTNQSNAEEIVYNSNYTRQGYITGLPILPVAGARWVF